MSIFHYLLPQFCTICHQRTDHHIDPNLCDDCHETCHHPPKICIFCDTYGAYLCHLCQKSFPKLQKIHIAFQYETTIRQLIQQLKFSLKPYLAKTISHLLWQHHINFFENLPKNTTIMPMPSGRFRVAKRGYNPVALIAKDLAKRSNLQFLERYLLKSAFSIPQTTLSRQQRLQNLHHHFWINSHFDQPEKLESILLIDDVITTGRSFEKAIEKLHNPQTNQLFGLLIAQS